MTGTGETGEARLVVHATTIALDARAVLLRGPSGSGKSDLALRMMRSGAELVADDRTELRVADGVLLASPPAVLAGRIEVRGVGVVAVPHRAEAPVALAVDLCDPETVARLPEARSERILGVALSVARLAPFEASAPDKLRLLLDRALAQAGGPMRVARP